MTVPFVSSCSFGSALIFFIGAALIRADAHLMLQVVLLIGLRKTEWVTATDRQILSGEQKVPLFGRQNFKRSFLGIGIFIQFLVIEWRRGLRS